MQPQDHSKNRSFYLAFDDNRLHDQQSSRNNLEAIRDHNIRNNLISLNKSLVELHRISQKDDELVSEMQAQNDHLNKVITQLRSYLYVKNIPFDQKKILAAMDSQFNLEMEPDSLQNSRRGASITQADAQQNSRQLPQQTIPASRDKTPTRLQDQLDSILRERRSGTQQQTQIFKQAVHK